MVMFARFYVVARVTLHIIRSLQLVFQWGQGGAVGPSLGPMGPSLNCLLRNVLGTTPSGRVEQKNMVCLPQEKA